MNFPPPHPLAAGGISFALILITIGLGYILGARVRSKLQAETAPIGAVVAAILGLLAFTLGFTFNIAASRFETRRSLVLEEANALGTLYLRSQLIAAPLGQRAMPLIRHYVEERSSIMDNPDKLPAIIRTSEQIHHQLWDVAKVLAQESPQSEITRLFIEALNEVIDLHTSRLTVALGYRIPPSVWMMLALVAGSSMLGVGYQFGAAGSLNRLASLILAITFSGVVMLIADLDHPYQGFLRVSQKPMQDLLDSIKGE